MPIDKETERAALLLLGVALLSKMADIFKQGAALLEEGNAALQQGGASLYEMVHPEQKDHANDLPPNPKPGQGVKMPPSEILALAQLVGFPDPKLAAAVAMAESGGWTANTAITPREYSVGLWQINTKVHPYTPEQMSDPMQNAIAAFNLFKKQGWKPWSAYKNGSYKRHQQGVLA